MIGSSGWHTVAVRKNGIGWPAAAKLTDPARVDEHVDDRGEQALRPLGRLGHLRVEGREHRRRVGVHRDEGAPAEAQAGGLGGRRGAVARHVAHHHGQAAVEQRDGVVEVAAHQQRPLGRLVAGGQAEAPHARQALGQEAALDRLPELRARCAGRPRAGPRRPRRRARPGTSRCMRLNPSISSASSRTASRLGGIGSERRPRVTRPTPSLSSATGPPTRRQSWRLAIATTISGQQRRGARSPRRSAGPGGRWPPARRRGPRSISSSSRCARRGRR